MRLARRGAGSSGSSIVQRQRRSSRRLDRGAPRAPFEASLAEVCLIAELEGDGLPVGLFVDRAVSGSSASRRRARSSRCPRGCAGMCGSYFVLGEDEIVGVVDPQKLVSAGRGSAARRRPAAAGRGDGRRAAGEGREEPAAPHACAWGGSLRRARSSASSASRPRSSLTPLPDTIEYFDGMADVGGRDRAHHRSPAAAGQSARPVRTSTEESPVHPGRCSKWLEDGHPRRSGAQHPRRPARSLRVGDGGVRIPPTRARGWRSRSASISVLTPRPARSCRPREAPAARVTPWSRSPPGRARPRRARHWPPRGRGGTRSAARPASRGAPRSR